MIFNEKQIIVGDVAPAQTEKPIMDSSAMDVSIEASTEKVFMVRPTMEAATQGVFTDQNPEAPFVTSKMRQFLSQLTPKETRTPPSTPESTPITVIEMESGSGPTVTAIATMDILEELTLHVIEKSLPR